MRRTPTSIAAALSDALAGSISPHARMGMGVASAHGDQQRPRLQPQMAPGLRRRAKLLPTAVAAPHLTSRCHRNIHRHGKSPLLLLPPHGAPADCRMSSSSLQPLLCDSGRRAGGGGLRIGETETEVGGGQRRAAQPVGDNNTRAPVCACS